jgi:membrane protein required for colicin V production
MKGFIVSIASLAGLILGFYFALRFSWYIEGILSNAAGSNSMLINLLAFVLSYMLVIIIVHVIGRSLQKMVELTPLGCFNRAAGLLFGLFKGMVLVSALIYLIEIVDQNSLIIKKESKESSLFYMPLAKLVPSLVPEVKDGITKQKAVIADSLLNLL